MIRKLLFVSLLALAAPAWAQTPAEFDSRVASADGWVQRLRTRMFQGHQANEVNMVDVTHLDACLNLASIGLREAVELQAIGPTAGAEVSPHALDRLILAEQLIGAAIAYLDRRGAK